MLRTAQVKKSRSFGQRVEVNLDYVTLMKFTGFGESKITEATKQLRERFYIERIEQNSTELKGKFGSSDYYILNPLTAEPFLHGADRHLFVGKMQYFLFPQCVVTEIEKPWCLAKLSGSELRLYTTICFESNFEGSLKKRASYLYTRSRLSRITFNKSLKALQNLGLIQIEDKSGVECEICLNDPYKRSALTERGEQPEDNLQNYHEDTGKSRTARIDLNLTSEQARQLFMKALEFHPGIATKPLDSNAIFIQCPYHSDSDPSCGVRFDRQYFKCFACTAKGKLQKLIMHLRNCSTEDYVQLAAEAKGTKAIYRQPDKDAEIYDYKDEHGNLKKQVLRYPGKEFQMRRKTTTGFQWDKCPAMLYNLDQFIMSRTICCVEGEKDADSVNRLKLVDGDGQPILATTSGGSDTWQDKFAGKLKGKRVIVMVDNDDPGKIYEGQIIESLVKRGIQHHTVSLPHGVKDVTDYLDDGNTVESLLALMVIGASRSNPSKPSRHERFCNCTMQFKGQPWLVPCANCRLCSSFLP
jgi:5S rRNA maturation endonuclease (ribonuclease M5)